jgi:hypothetical protein
MGIVEGCLVRNGFRVEGNQIGKRSRLYDTTIL